MMNLKRLVLFLFILNCSAAFAARYSNMPWLEKYNSFNTGFHNDNDTIVIPFGYKQSALYHTYTFEVIDSVVNILKRDTAVRLTIDGYSYVDEGNDTVCKYLSLNRALFVKEYVLGRGIDLSRIISVNGLGKSKSQYRNTDNQGKFISCRAELLLVYPPPPPKIVISDRDLDGIADADDNCPDEYGYADTKGCPNKDVIIVPFENKQSSLYYTTYKVLDSVVGILKDNPSFTIAVSGHSYKEEGSQSVCDNLAMERANITKEYLLSRYIGSSRIDSLKSFGNTRPLNAGRNPQEKNGNARVEIILNRHL